MAILVVVTWDQRTELKKLKTTISAGCRTQSWYKFSLLPTEDAVASCVLSKRWRGLWKSIYNFRFVYRYNKKAENFRHFVDHVVTHSTCSKIKSFQLNIASFLFAVEREVENLDFCSDLVISQWLSFAVEREVENLDFCSSLYFTFLLPLSVCSSSSLIALKLSGSLLDKRLVIVWNSLKSLNLDSIELDDDGIVNLLSGCPALETLELSYFRGFRRLEITSSNLKKLILSGYMNLHDDINMESLEIIAPHLQDLEISGHLGHLMCRLVNVSSLVTASLTFVIRCISMFGDTCGDYHQVSRNLVMDYLEKLSHVTHLRIGSWLAEVVFMLQLDELLLPELRCKCLTLEMNETKYNLYGVASLLRISPLLETLNIHMGVEGNCFLSGKRAQESYVARTLQKCCRTRVGSSNKYTKFGGSDTHPTTFLKSPSNISRK